MTGFGWMLGLFLTSTTVSLLAVGIACRIRNLTGNALLLGLAFVGTAVFAISGLWLAWAFVTVLR